MIHSARPVLSNIPSPMLPATYQIILIIWISVSSRASPTGDVLRYTAGRPHEGRTRPEVVIIDNLGSCSGI